jgi:beta-N-acetylhexosaminidase
VVGHLFNVPVTECRPVTRSKACIFGCASLALDPREAEFFRDTQPWGFILFGRNVQDRAQLVRLTADLRHAVGWHAPILIDQEGGRVARMAPPTWRGWPPPLDVVEALAPVKAERSFWIRGRGIAHDLTEVGIDVNCAPVADVARPTTHAVLRNRCLGSDPDTVIRNARAMTEGLLAGGVLPIVKHPPGYGLGQVDSHLELPRVSASRTELEAVDFAPFKALANLKMAMTAHLVYEAIDPERAGTVSPAMIELIRNEIGFDGLLMTDDISMEALSGTIVERGRASLAAGCDLVLHCNGKMPEMEALAAELPDMSENAHRRADEALAQRSAPVPVDIAALDAEFSALMQRVV